MNSLFWHDAELQATYPVLAGIDEAGRGPLAGPLVVASVILRTGFEHPLLDDSKKVNAKTRTILYESILENSVCYHIEIIPPAEIDRVNILQATLNGMRTCAHNLKIEPQLCLIDGNKIPSAMPYPAKSVIQGDGFHACIAAASIVAKVTRDTIMEKYEMEYPGYGFAQHKGYPTPAHLEALSRLGVSPIHRLTYAPVQQLTLSFE